MSHSRLGSVDRPFQSAEPAAVSLSIVAEYFTGVHDSVPFPTLIRWRNQIYHYADDRWGVVDADMLEQVVLGYLTNTYYARISEEGVTCVPLTEKRCNPGTVVKRLLTQVTIDPAMVPPFNVRTRSAGDPGRVTFRNKTFDLLAGSEESTAPWWFEPSALRVDYDPEADCPLWHQCLEQWSGGDPNWKSCLQRMMGYALMGSRQYQKWFLLYGVPRAGKGTILAILKALLSEGAVAERDLQSLSSHFGLDGLQSARVLIVNEVFRLERASGSRAASVLKQIVGGDGVTIDAKFQRVTQSVVIPALPILQSNEVPMMNDTAGSLSSKLILLPFTRTFRGHEDFFLQRRLKAELQGIARWCLEGARDLVATNGQFPEPLESAVVITDMESLNCPYNAFLEDKFELCPGNWVDLASVWDRWVQWRKENRDLAKELPRGHMNWFSRVLLDGTNWPLTRRRRNGRTGLTGLKIRPREEISPLEDLEEGTDFFTHEEDD